MISIIISDTVCVDADTRNVLSDAGMITYAEGATYCALRSGVPTMHYTHAWPHTIATVLELIELYQSTWAEVERQKIGMMGH